MQRLKEFILFIIFCLALSCISMPILLIYGPFPKLRTTLGESLLTTMRHRSWARLLLSEEEIKQFTKKRFESYKTEASDRNLSTNKDDHRVELFEVSGRRFKGKVILVHDPLMMEVGYSKNLPETGETVSQMAKREHALAGIRRLPRTGHRRMA
jgi:exopolysaccharide biosynthesis protein